MKFDHIVAFTDGACTGNPGPGGWGAVYVMPSGEVVELGGGMTDTTNNRMEMVAVCKVLEHLAKNNDELTIYTDSVYVIRGITEWIHGWRKRGWKNSSGAEVQNKDLWQWMGDMVRDRSAKIDWKFVRGHKGVAGNERVDDIAVAYAKKKRIDLYRGPLVKYDVPIFDLPEDEPVPEIKQKTEKAKAYSYLSVVDGIPKRHTNWKDCELRVKGRSGARFKKAMSPDDEKTILKGWGITETI